MSLKKFSAYNLPKAFIIIVFIKIVIIVMTIIIFTSLSGSIAEWFTLQTSNQWIAVSMGSIPIREKPLFP
jgi:hypothetical protein